MTAAGGWSAIGAGALVGGASGVSAGFTGGFLNSLAFGNQDKFFSGDPLEALVAGGKGAIIGGGTGAALGAGRNALDQFLPEEDAYLTTGKGPVSHSAIEGRHELKEYKISVGPGEARQGPFKTIKGTPYHPSHSRDGLGSTMRISRISSEKLFNYAQSLQESSRSGTLKWNLLGKYSCVQHASTGLRQAGAVSAGFSVHPHWLQVKMAIRQGILRILGLVPENVYGF